MAPNKGKQKIEEVDTGILDDIPTPITTFDLSDQTKFSENYESCMKDIRKYMEDETKVKFTFVMADKKEVVVPVTPAEDVTSKGTYVIRLEYGDKRLDLVAEKYQTWFRGIVTNSGHRFEIDEKFPKIMKNSGSLHTIGSYPKLIDCLLENLKVGYQQLLSAFETFSGFKGDPKDLTKVKEAIAILLITFFEGPRLVTVEEFTKDLLCQFSSGEVGDKNEGLIRNWCDDSRSFYEKADGVMKIVVPDDTSDVVYKAATTFRIMCRSAWDKWVQKSNEEGRQPQASPKHVDKKGKGESSKEGGGRSQ